MIDSRKYIKYGYKYKGYEYCPDRESDGEVVKTFHTVYAPNGEAVEFDWSPYSLVPEDIFQKWIDLGCPPNRGFGPFTVEDINEMFRKKESGLQ